MNLINKDLGSAFSIYSPFSVISIVFSSEISFSPQLISGNFCSLSFLSSCITFSVMHVVMLLKYVKYRMLTKY